jgi:hypothetical protein
MKWFAWIPSTYYWLLWYFGFADTDGNLQTPDDREKITYMLRRMKERMGIVWWIIALGSMFAVWTLMILVSWWWVLLVAFQVWLFVHVLWPYTPPDITWGGKQ